MTRNQIRPGSGHRSRPTVSGVLWDSHLKRGGGRRSGLVSGFCAVEASVLQLAEHRWQGGRRRQLGSAQHGPARPGPAGCSSTRRSSGLRGSSSGRDGFKAGEQQLSSGSGASAAARPPFLWVSDWVQCRLGVGGLLLLLIFLFHGRRAEAAGRKEGRKKTRGWCWET